MASRATAKAGVCARGTTARHGGDHGAQCARPRERQAREADCRGGVQGGRQGRTHPATRRAASAPWPSVASPEGGRPAPAMRAKGHAQPPSMPAQTTASCRLSENTMRRGPFKNSLVCPSFCAVAANVYGIDAEPLSDEFVTLDSGDMGETLPLVDELSAVRRPSGVPRYESSQSSMESPENLEKSPTLWVTTVSPKRAATAAIMPSANGIGRPSRSSLARSIACHRAASAS